MKKNVLIAAIIAILIIIIVGMALVLTGVVSLNSAQEQGDGEAKQETNTALPTPTYIALDPPFTVSFTDADAAQFLQLSLNVATTNQDVQDAISRHMPAIRNALVMLFASQDSTDLKSREGKEKLRQEALGEINRVLEHAAGVPGVDDVFFTNFVMQ